MRFKFFLSVSNSTFRSQFVYTSVSCSTKQVYLPITFSTWQKTPLSFFIHSYHLMQLGIKKLLEIEKFSCAL